MRRIVLLRHAEADKNLADRHGGAGTGLTERGRSQCDLLAQDLKSYFPQVARLFVLPKPQCIETAERISSNAGLSIETLAGFSPFHLGVLDGLSRAEARDRYPALAEAMDRWRRGLDEIHALRIPGATDPTEFYKQGVQLVGHLSAIDREVVVVGTRSVLVLLWNVLRGRTPEVGGGYFERPWANLEWVEFTEVRKTEWREDRTQRPPPELS